MSTVAEILEAAERLGPAEFLKLRSQLDEVEERLWKGELDRAGAKHRNAKLTDSQIDVLVSARRQVGRRS